MKFMQLSRNRKVVGAFMVIACLVLVLPNYVSGYTALSGAEFVVYPSAD